MRVVSPATIPLDFNSKAENMKPISDGEQKFETIMLYPQSSLTVRIEQPLVSIMKPVTKSVIEFKSVFIWSAKW